MPNVDFLSRSGATNDPDEKEESNPHDDEIDLTIGTIVIQQGILNDIDWKQEQLNDNDLKIIRQWKEQGIYPPESDIKKMNIDTQKYFQIRNNITIDPRSKIILYEKMQFEHPEIDKYRILLPKAKRIEGTRRFHREGHFSATVTASRILNHFWMPRIFAPITEYIAKCLECQLKKNQS